MLHLVSGISFCCLFVNLILVLVPPFLTHLFIHPSLLPLLIHHLRRVKLVAATNIYRSRDVKLVGYT